MTLIMNKPIAMKHSTLLIPLDSFLYLQNECSVQRLGKELTEKGIARLTQNFKSVNRDGFAHMHDGDLGGCNGKPENSYEERRWTRWSIADMKRMLDAQGLSYKDGDQEEVIHI